MASEPKSGGTPPATPPSQTTLPSSLNSVRPSSRNAATSYNSSPAAVPLSKGQGARPESSAIVHPSPPASAGLSVPDEAASTSRLPTPTIIVHDEQNQQTPNGQMSSPSAPARSANGSANGSKRTSFLPIDTLIPTGDFEDLTSPDRLQFSNRGSIIMLDGSDFSKRPASSPVSTTKTEDRPARRHRQNGALAVAPSSDATRVLSVDEESLSQRIRSFYEAGTEDLPVNETLHEEEEDDSRQGALDAINGMSSLSIVKTPSQRGYPGSPLSPRSSFVEREPHEAAGGTEDWEDIKGDEVDRYGFIVKRKSDSRGSAASGGTFESPHLTRISTSLLEASKTPRRKPTLRRKPSRASSRPASAAGTPSRKPSRRSLKPAGSVYSHRSSRSSFANSQGSLRSPMSGKDKKLVIDAGDMLTLPPGMAEAADRGSIVTQAMREKEWEREKKWKKMSKLKPESTVGGTMLFEFDAQDPKVISRTWKGIPDRWRATAWYSFLASSAKRRAGSPSEEELFAAFHKLQAESSTDDVQIDCDVPRTINRHIMFRRRYRGGQRLLFRVLHALSLYFPDVGYVQGMAALAATLLCYFDEEHAFVVTVRLWQLRGLSRLYESGFQGLMDALNEFEQEWIAGSEVAKKLEELGIHSTAYGTRWYLTLFNYSIPFPAQLRVWDVFMLLGDQSNACGPANGFGADLDVLHATSAALIDATREILIDSDFENAMKVLTSWIPVKDEDLLMRVANAEWKQRKRRHQKG